MPDHHAPSTFRLAMVQMCVEGGRKAENLARAEQRIAEAAARTAKVVLLPEALTLGWTHPSAQDQAESIPDGESCQRLSECAKRHRLYLCAGLVERSGKNVFNAAVLIGPNGELLLHHRKINELDIGHPFYDLGDRLHATQTPLASFGVMICADAFARGQVITRTLGLMGANVILSPCAWAVPANHDNAREPYGKLWLDNYGPVARDFQLWIAGTSNVGDLTAGPWAGRHCIGCSLLVGPDGKQVLMGPYGRDAEAILYADVTPRKRPARGDDWEKLWTKRL
ncbi:MAG TPA: carbon-nitrogen hydrolase family protein [Candidatus Limnocylindrales bacterium]|jgi:predicted amidohydrolase|nr:carbon-nitrogen hydrolase family protein [Candidatus Limnocylindrales bacterium]